MSRIIDIFPDFLKYWKKACKTGVEERLKLWKQIYMANWPELFRKQVNCYSKEGFDWIQISKEHVFPYLDSRLARMKAARRILLNLCDAVYKKASEKFNFNFDVKFVTYVGIGCGSGWATKYEGSPAILFGLENIAEEDWVSNEVISGLIAHELGHLYHSWLRGSSGLKMGSGAL